jgi:ATP-dependent 26S proteasome regulatory subunit
MIRRINLAIEFKLPDFNLRREIWRSHLPPDIAVAADVEWTKLAMNFELAGGFIKNVGLRFLPPTLRSSFFRFFFFFFSL